MFNGMKVFCGNASKGLTEDICQYLRVPIGDCQVSTFSDGETIVKINENVRGADVFIINSTCPPPNHNIMELLILIDAAKRASAQRITAVIPYYGYARQDRKDRPRAPITSKLVANLIVIAGADRVLTIDLHADQIQGFFDIPVDHLYATPLLLDYFKGKDLKNLVIVAPDTGAAKRSRSFAQRLNVDLAIVDKRRPAPNVAEILHIIGDVQGRDVVILDDLIDTAGTVVLAASALKERGALRVFAACSHGVLSGPAIERISSSVLEELVVTNTIPLPPEKKIDKIKVLSISPLLGEAIKRIHEGTSVSSLFV